jgi:hypothetical protein
MRGASHPKYGLQRLALALPLLLGWSVSAHAEPDGMDLLSAETLTATADFRLTAGDGEPSWTIGGFGKTRYGSDGPDLSVKPRFADANIVWQPRFTWSLSGTVVGTVQGGKTLQPGLSEAYLSWKPLNGGPVRLSGRAGLMWPPVSLEHGGGEWAVNESITPSAINSWMGEEVKVVGAELGASFALGQHKMALTGALFDMNDTAGALLAFRGWAVHDRKAMIFRAQPLPPLNSFIVRVQPRYSHPIIEMDGGYMKRPGYYAKVAWDLPVPVHVEYIHYDNGSNPASFDEYLEWGWRTKFDNVGLVATVLPETQLRIQGMSGSTVMGYPMPTARWVDMHFRSGYALLTHYFARGSVSGRIETFRTRNRGSTLTSVDDEDGWSAMLAARRNLGPHMTALVEALHIESDKAARARAGLPAQQSTTQLQMSLRLRW